MSTASTTPAPRHRRPTLLSRVVAPKSWQEWAGGFLLVGVLFPVGIDIVARVVTR